MASRHKRNKSNKNEKLRKGGSFPKLFASVVFSADSKSAYFSFCYDIVFSNIFRNISAIVDYFRIGINIFRLAHKNL